MKEQFTAERNPYETPGIGRLHHTSNYVWPIADEKRLSFYFSINDLQLSKSVEANSQFVNGSRWSSGFCIFALSLAILFESIMRFDTFSLVFNVGALAVLCFILPRCFYGWHTRRLKSNFQWLWGKVHVEISSKGFRWENDSVALLIPWDSFHTLRFASNCVWISTQYPFPLAFPIYRSWVDESMWREIREVFSAHKGFFDIENFLIFHQPKLVAYAEACAPEVPPLDGERISYRARDNGQGYANETVKLFSGYAWMFVMIFPMLHFAAAVFPQIEAWDDATIGLRKNGYWIYVLFGFGFLQFAIQSVLRWFGAGIRWYQWSQSLLSSQSGYVSIESIYIASPAYQLAARLVGQASVRLEKDCMVLELRKNGRQSLVIPKDQFSEADANKAWLLFAQKR